MNIRQLERRVRQIEEERITNREKAFLNWQRRFTIATMEDDELTELLYPLVEAQFEHGFDSPEAEAEFERIKDEFERILEERYIEFLDGPIE